MLEWKKITTTLMCVSIVGMVGFFVDFQIFKGRVEAVEKEVNKIDELKDLQCEVALFMFKDNNKKVLRHCRE